MNVSEIQICNTFHTGSEINDLLMPPLINRDRDVKPGISVASVIEGYNEQLLTISTEIRFLFIRMEQINYAATFRFASIFRLEDDELLTQGLTETAMTIVRKTHDLAQAHAYSMFCLLCAQIGLPPSRMEITPFSKHKKMLESFLIQNIK